MEEVTGIGFFFCSPNADHLNQWYEQHPGIRQVGQTYEEGSWWQDKGPTVFASESQDSPGMGDPRHARLINFCVRNLDAMVAQLRAASIPVEVETPLFQRPLRPPPRPRW